MIFLNINFFGGLFIRYSSYESLRHEKCLSLQHLPTRWKHPEGKGWQSEKKQEDSNLISIFQ